MSERRDPKEGEEYRHYRGALYVVLGVAIHTERRGERLVVYRGVSSGILYARPIALFSENVVVDGRMVPRFKKL